MSKIPYLFRRGNIFYFRIAVPVQLRDKFQCREVILSLKTEKRTDAVPLALGHAAEIIKLFNDAKTMTDILHKRQLMALRQKLKIKEDLHQEELEQRERSQISELKRIKAGVSLEAENKLLREVVAAGSVRATTAKQGAKLDSPLLSFVIDDFIAQYDKTKSSMLTKHAANLPVLLELLGDVRVDQIRHIDLSKFADDLCKLPRDRSDPKFKGLSFKQMIDANKGECIHLKTFNNYKSSVKQLIEGVRGRYEGVMRGLLKM